MKKLLLTFNPGMTFNYMSERLINFVCCQEADWARERIGDARRAAIAATVENAKIVLA